MSSWHFVGQDCYLDLVSSFSGDNPKTILEHAEFELMIEWGLTPEEFYNIDIEVIRKILEYRDAQSKGESKKYNIKPRAR